MRRFYLSDRDDGQLKPTREGVALRLKEWDDLLNLLETISDAYPKLRTAVPCYLQDDHLSQLVWLECRECNPIGPGRALLDEFFPTSGGDGTTTVLTTVASAAATVANDNAV